MLKNSFSLLFLSALILAGCGSENKNKDIKSETEETVPVINPGDTIYLSDNYPEFPSQKVSYILDSMQFCDLKPDESLPDSLQLYPCTADFFGVFPNNDQYNPEKGFLMEARQGVWAKSSRVFNLEKVDGVFLVTNDLKGQLLYMIPNKNGKHDIVLRYYDSQVGTIAVEHKFSGKSYKPVNVIMLNDYPVKKEFQDSLNHVYLDNFVWGY